MLLNDIPSIMNAANSSYKVSVQAIITFSSLLGEVLSGEVPFFAPNSVPMVGIPWMSAIWNSTTSLADTNAMASRIADTLSNYMRTSAPAPLDARYAPTVFADQTFIRVRWAWLSFPLSLLVAGHVFLAATIWQTKRRRVPLLLANVDEVVRDRARGAFETRTGLEERVGRMKVRLEYEGREAIAFRKVG